jgi:hypothetical protein
VCVCVCEYVHRRFFVVMIAGANSTFGIRVGLHIRWEDGRERFKFHDASVISATLSGPLAVEAGATR